jgi:hypothetical protein
MGNSSDLEVREISPRLFTGRFIPPAYHDGLEAANRSVCSTADHCGRRVVVASSGMSQDIIPWSSVFESMSASR